MARGGGIACQPGVCWTNVKTGTLVDGEICISGRRGMLSRPIECIFESGGGGGGRVPLGLGGRGGVRLGLGGGGGVRHGLGRF